MRGVAPLPSPGDNVAPNGTYADAHVLVPPAENGKSEGAPLLLEMGGAGVACAARGERARRAWPG
jgi:hypothetical protein